MIAFELQLGMKSLYLWPRFLSSLRNIKKSDTGNWKSPFSDAGKVEGWDSKLVGGSKPESLPVETGTVCRNRYEHRRHCLRSSSSSSSSKCNGV